MITVLLKASFIIAVTWLFYKLILQQETFFGSNRWYLICCLVLAFTLPFVTLPPLVENQGVISDWVEPVTPTLSEVVVNPNPQSPAEQVVDQPVKTTTGWTTWLVYGYAFGALIFFINLLVQLGSIFWNVRMSQDKILDDGCLIINTPRPQAPCSFFHYIFIHPPSYDLATYEKIIAHEKIHVRQKHSWDLLLAELAVILLWFNPLIWLFKKEVERNLEFQTDRMLLQGDVVDKKDYQLSLVQIANRYKPLTITTNYNQSLLKNRIVMMNSKLSTSHRYWKYAFIVPLVFGVLLMINKPQTVARAADPGPNPIPTYTDGSYANDCQDLLRAVKANNLDRVKVLLKSVNPNCEYRGDGEPRSALVAAAREGYEDIVKALLAANADVEYHAAGDEPPLMAASAHGHISLVRLMVTEGADVNRKSSSNGTALLTAARSGQLEVVEYLITQGADVNAEVQGDGTALIQAVRNGHYQVSKVLLEQGADPYQNVPGDEYAMYHARVSGNKQMVKLLERYGSQ